MKLLNKLLISIANSSYITDTDELAHTAASKVIEHEDDSSLADGKHDLHTNYSSVMRHPHHSHSMMKDEVIPMAAQD